MRCMIMAAGLGTRLRPLTDLIPKPMATILNRPVLYHILKLLKMHGVEEVVINLHHFPESVTSYFGDGTGLGMAIRYSVEQELLGTAGGVKNNEEFLSGDTFLVVSGDALTDVDLTALIAGHRSRGGIATLAVKEVEDPSQYGVVLTDSTGRVRGFQEKPSAREALSRMCNCGIYVFEPAIFNYIPPNAFYDFGRQVFADLLKVGRPFYAQEADGYWNDVGSLEEYRRGSYDALLGRVRVEIPGREAAPSVWLGRQACVDPSVRVKPPVLVGDGCRVGESVVLEGPVIVGDHCIVEPGASLSAAIVAGGSSVGAESVVAGAIIGRGCRLGPRVRLDGAVIGDRCLVAEGTDLGSAVLGACSVVGAGRDRQPGRV